MSLEHLCQRIGSHSFARYYGRVKAVRRDHVRAFIPHAKVGATAVISTSEGPIRVEIVGLDPEGHVAMPLDDLGTVQLGDRVSLSESDSTFAVGDAMLGRVIDSMGVPYEGAALEGLTHRLPLYGSQINPMKRAFIRSPLDLGVRAINACLTMGRGQRQGIFAGSGVGKSVLLGMMARYTAADVVVIGLIGERGREVREFLEHDLGPQGRKKSVVVVETADKSPVRRARGAFVATTVAEYFRDQGAQVLLMMDSLTRFAMAQREIGVAAGEPPASKGYTPSVFAQVSRLVERAGNWGAGGSISGLYTVLVEGDDLEDPVADNARAILDGHIVLSRRLANRGYYPAIDVLASVSRVMDQVVEKDHLQAARRLKELLARYRDNEDAIQYGMYHRGTDPAIDECMDYYAPLVSFLRQDRAEPTAFADCRSRLVEAVGG